MGYNNWPEYTGETPTKQGDEQYTYEFAGWSPELAPVTEEAVYTATYALYVRSYNISFVNYDGTILQSDYVEYGDMPYYYGWETPYKPATDEYYYEFIGWSPEITSVTGDATYTATFAEIKRTYNVYFYNGDYLLGMYELPYGETPAYTGETPTQPETQEYTYEFTGWSPELSPVTGEAYYYATFTEVRKQQHTIAYYYAGSAGYFANTCYTGQDFTVRILAHEGNTIQSVTLNGVDITSQLEADGTLTLYNITEDQTLVVSTRDIPSNISSSTPNHLRAWQANGTIFAEVDDNVATLQLYDVSGRLMNEYRHNGNYQVITLPAPNEVNILKVVGKDGSITAHKLM